MFSFDSETFRSESFVVRPEKLLGARSRNIAYVVGTERGGAGGGEKGNI